MIFPPPEGTEMKVSRDGKPKSSQYLPNFDPEEPDCMTLVLMGEHIDPAELSQISDQGYTNLLLITTALGALVNVVLSIGKIIAGRVWHSQAVFADGIHSLSDLVSDIVAAGTGYLAGRRPDETMPFAYGKFESVGALWVAIMLLVTAGTLLYHLYAHFQNTLTGEVPLVELPAMFTAVVSTVLKELSFQGTYRVAVKVNSQVLIANAWHHRSDALSSVAALVGCIGAWAGYVWADALAGGVVALMLAKLGVEMAVEAVGDLVDKSALEDEDRTAIEDEVKHLAASGTLRGAVTKLRARAAGRKKHLYMVVEFAASISIGDATRQVEEMRVALRKRVHNIGEIVVQFAPPLVPMSHAGGITVSAGRTSFRDLGGISPRQASLDLGDAGHRQ